MDSSAVVTTEMRGGIPCQDRDSAYVEPVCPTGAGGPTGGDAYLESKNWHTETTSYVSVGLFNLYLSTTITSSGIFLGIFLGVLLTGGMWVGVEKRRKKLQRKEAKEKEKEKANALELSLQKVLVSSTGTHSNSWPAFKTPPGGLPQPATAPPAAPLHPNHQLVPLAWGQ